MTRRNRFQYSSLFSTPKRYRVRKRWRIRYVLWNALRRTCTVIGSMVLLSAFISIVLTVVLINKPPKPLPDSMVLFWHAKSGLAEGEQSLGPLGYPGSLKTPRPTLLGMVDTLDKAKSDKRVKGFVVVLDNSSLSMAHISEFHDAIKRFRDAGKFAYIVAPSYGQLGRGLGTYYLATAFDEIWLLPVGTLSMTGVRFEVPLARAALDKIGVEPEFFQREEYKSVFESMTNTEMSAASRESTKSLVDSIVSYVVSGIQENRDLDKVAIRNQIDRGILTADEALQAGLVDRVDYADVLMKRVKQDVIGDPDTDELLFVGTGTYLKKVGSRQRNVPRDSVKPGVALIYISGAISQTEKMNSSYAFIGGSGVSANKVSAAIMEAAEDEDIESIVVRIDSPGGTPVAAEIIHRTLYRAKEEKGKKVVVSMGAVAASAGYWIAAPADKIFAAPMTLTGSIGVAGGKFNMKGLWDKVGVNWEDVQWGRNAGILSLNEPFSVSGTERMNTLMDKTYDVFIARVAEGRKMSIEDVRKVAKGRVWTGQQALELGLVDEVGGLSDALNYAATLAGVKDRMDVDIQVLPKPKKPIEQLIEILEQQVHMGEGINSQMRLMSLVQPFLNDISVMQMADDGLLSYEFRQLD